MSISVIKQLPEAKTFVAITFIITGITICFIGSFPIIFEQNRPTDNKVVGFMKNYSKEIVFTTGFVVTEYMIK